MINKTTVLALASLFPACIHRNAELPHRQPAPTSAIEESEGVPMADREGLYLSFEQDAQFREGMVQKGEEILKALYGNPELLNLSPSQLMNSLGLNQIFDEMFARKLGKFSEESSVRRNYMTAIAAVMWAQAARGEIYRDSAAYSVLDPHDVIYRFNLKYVAMQYKEQDPKNFREKLQNMRPQELSKKGNSLAYNRDPSPLVANSHMWGIDMRLDESSKLLPILPGEKGHLMFGTFSSTNGNQRTFLCAEDVGAGTWRDILARAANFMDRFKAQPKDYRGVDKEKILRDELRKLGVTSSDIKRKPLFDILTELEEQVPTVKTKKKREKFDALNKKIGDRAEILSQDVPLSSLEKKIEDDLKKDLLDLGVKKSHIKSKTLFDILSDLKRQLYPVEEFKLKLVSLYGINDSMVRLGSEIQLDNSLYKHQGTLPPPKPSLLNQIEGRQTKIAAKTKSNSFFKNTVKGMAVMTIAGAVTTALETLDGDEASQDNHDREPSKVEGEDFNEDLE